MIKRSALFLFVFAAISFTAIAQNSAPTLTSDAETDLGTNCPVSAALSPDGQALWVLMDNCFGRNYTLRAFTVPDGAPLDVDDHAGDLAPLERGYVDPFVHPLAFVANDILSIRYSDAETYDLRSLMISISGGPLPDSPFVSDDTLTALLRDYTDYPEFAVYSPDHSLVAAGSDAAFHILDLRTGDELLTIASEQASFGALVGFSYDSQAVYVASLDDPDDYENYNAVLTIYSVPDGETMGEYAVPSPLLTISPDGRYAIAEAGSADSEESWIWLVDLADGSISEKLSMYEPPRPVTTCTNSGNNVSDLNYRTSGKLSMRSVTWLPDSTTFLVTRSFSGEGAGGGLPCFFNTSRLNWYSVGP